MFPVHRVHGMMWSGCNRSLAMWQYWQRFFAASNTTFLIVGGVRGPLPRRRCGSAAVVYFLSPDNLYGARFECAEHRDVLVAHPVSLLEPLVVCVDSRDELVGQAPS